MQDRENNRNAQSEKYSEYAGKSHGQQGVDKAPGEEPSEDNVQFTMESQKGKKVDADLEQSKDRPLDKQDL
ncbi:MAG TPA: hypothetical protein VEZ55_16670 [Chitinophagaceae bacterium]|nr:hypothetical protein [Chitinophagaceae bacterium]